MNDIERLREIDTEIYYLETAAALLSWDQETYMPKRGISGRAEQLAALQTLIHQKTTSDEIGRILDQYGVSDETPSGDHTIDSFEGAFLRAWNRKYGRQKKLPEELIGRIARETSKAQATWSEAKEQDNFEMFAPSLEIVLGLAREVAEHIGYKEHPYDALLDEYEPGMKTAEVTRIFSELGERLAPIVANIASAPQIDDSFFQADFAVADQEAFGREVLADLGFPTDSGRLDVSSHPFTITIGGNDVRLTTRYAADHFQTSLFGTIHEAGHGLYELGFGESIANTVLAVGTSLGIHESQSRTWENLIGRSRPFWNRYLPRLVEYFPDQLRDVTIEKFYRAINKVEPSFIRVEADEVTYGLHIILRTTIEPLMITGDLKIADLPDAWRSESKRLLGIEPPTDSLGLLQDIHWSMGGFGYFPTYLLGNLYGAQFDRAMRETIGDVSNLIEAGDFATILDWQRNNIHAHGSSKTAAELCDSVTGERLNPSYFGDYIEQKFSEVYGL